MQENSLQQFLTDLLYILRLTIPRYLGKPSEVGQYPRRMSEGDVPLPNVSHPGDHDWADEWKGEMVGGILCNPIHAGIPPFEPMVNDQTWIAAGVKLAAQVGLRQYLTNVLYELKKSVSKLSFDP